MGKIRISLTAIFLLSVCRLSAQMPDTTGLYKERKDTLQTAVFSSSREGNYLLKNREIRTEVISAAGLCKMACCSLAESFENSASVTVGYSDAVTGARQIKLLGQSGIYTQMLDENRPVMRGLSAPFGLNYIPGQWLESIQIAKGVTSVINGVESMTGQINMEHRKPTDEKPLYVQASIMHDTKMDLNIASSLQLDPLSTWSTVILGHIDGNIKAMDHNGDGFMDDPRQLNIALSNRWLYFGQDGVQVRFGVRGIQDHRLGGQTDEASKTPWRADILNRSLGGYVKVGKSLLDDKASLALVSDYTYQDMRAGYGISKTASYRFYNAGQHSAFANLLFQHEVNESHKYTVGLSEMLDRYDEAFCTAGRTPTLLNDAGIFGEYTYHKGDVFSAIAGLRGDWYNRGRFRFSPRLTLKYSPIEQLVLRANGGRGIRYSTPLVDNFGVLATAKQLKGDLLSHPLEESWTVGANATWYLPWDKNKKTYLSLDYFYSIFTNQMLVGYRNDAIEFYELSSLKGGYSHTNNWQVDFATEPLRGFTISATARITDARQTSLPGMQSDDIKPMTSQYKCVLNLQYATRLNKWIFDLTASVNGPCRVWDFMRDRYASGKTPVYPLLYAQVTRRFKMVDVYVGGENLTNYRQSDPIISAADPLDSRFDASCIWGPVMGIRVYAGVRFTLWKTN